MNVEPNAYEKNIINKFQLETFFGDNPKYKDYFSEIVNLVYKIGPLSDYYLPVVSFGQVLLKQSPALFHHANSIQSNIAKGSGGDLDSDLWDKIIKASVKFLLWDCLKTKQQSHNPSERVRRS